MSATLKSLRALSDPTRLRIVALLERDELSVNELQEITAARPVAHLNAFSACWRDCVLVQARREGKRTFYKLNPQTDGTAGEFIQLRHPRREGAARTRRRPDQSQARGEPPAGNRRRFISIRLPGGSTGFYGPGRSWQAFGHLLLRILPPRSSCRLNNPSRAEGRPHERAAGMRNSRCPKACHERAGPINPVEPPGNLIEINLRLFPAAVHHALEIDLVAAVFGQLLRAAGWRVG